MRLSSIDGFRKVCNLTPVLIKKIASDPQHSIEEIATVADQVFATLSQTPADLGDAEAFIKKLEVLNDALKKGPDQQGPFDATLTKLKDRIKPSKSPLAVAFEKIKALDIGSHLLGEKITEAKSALQKAEQHGQMTLSEYYSICRFLDSLTKPGFYEPSSSENTLLEQLANQYPAMKKAMRNFPEVERECLKLTRTQMLKEMKSHLTTPAQLIEALNASYAKLSAELPATRLTRLSPELTQEPPFDKNFVTSFPLLVKAFENFSSEIAIPQMSKLWATILAEYEKTHHGKFGALLKNYAYCDPEAQLSDLVRQAQEKYFKLFDMEMINTAQPEAVQSAIVEADIKARRNIEKFFLGRYASTFSARHEWLSANASNIKKSYNQNVDIHRDLGGGTCLRNSLDRDKMLAINPAIEGGQIDFGSSAQGRFAEAREAHEKTRIETILKQVKSGFSVLSEAEIHSYLEALTRLEREELKRIGLAQIAEISIAPNSANVTQPLMEAIDTAYHSRGKSMHCVVMLGGSGGDGHAMNIQLDETRHQFRFMDDNLGDSEYASYNEFKTKFQNLIKSFYKEFSEFSLRFYRTL